MGAEEHDRGERELDAMGLDKRRAVIGGRYSPSVPRQVAIYGLFLAGLAVLIIVALIAVNRFDQPPDEYPDSAPWAAESAPEIEPAPVDFPRNGSSGPVD